MGQKASFVYREFYDVPRMIILWRGDSQILLESAFDSKTDEYSTTYKVFVLPNISEDELQGSWENLASKGTKLVGEILVENIEFDATLRKQIDTAVLDDLLTRS